MGKLLRVLIVEDSEDDAALLLWDLRRGGYAPAARRVETADTMKKALQEEKWDLVISISDHALPNFSAPAALAVLKETRLDLPFIIVSGNTGEEAAVAAMQVGAHDYVTKNSPTRLLSTIERELKEAARRRELRRAEKAWATINSSQDGIAMTDPNHILLYTNQAFSEIFGIENINEYVGNPVEKIQEAMSLKLARPEAYREFMIRQWETDSERVLELDHLDGRIFLLYTGPVKDERGESIGRWINLRNVTREKEVDQMKSESVSLASHDLRTPLTSLIGFTELMLSRELPEEKRRIFTETIHREAHRLAGVIDHFLDLQKIESGRIAYRKDPVDLPVIISRVKEVFSGGLSKHTFRIDLPPGLRPVRGDPDRLQQVLSNLVSNAIKFSPGGGEILISASRTDGEVVISVQDQGLGVPAEARDRLFTKFYRIDSPDRREIRGTGLGLAICRQIIEAHGGRIWVESEAGKGSTFSFSVPLDSQEEVRL